ncbi:uncharacterized protein PV07_11808 [Cladophialophora immunda]|uniref:Transcription factor domain-containing protein n=1 Tax=Cladophialophora immunda TaxID=569365 RepID=A0A0D2AFH5_9EURO|nr:uncharacterized protein PV07_11808 [Cladophialophora immunda]KIW23622.1 hypothetical protein PV07_11808 [Cladophialophora immunda]OQV05752.1 hypothetical protein CLAIMM_10429 isoform 1 [Cladophialophora immunda]OQV05753.1 hypothetical protein CLAIMM_10429 isoform 2 [Cladophialophora immunda]OQV05754.1 hypothetical protein CLAIMM_10429 isoform 3 [Cladophialophora immunda]
MRQSNEETSALRRLQHRWRAIPSSRKRHPSTSKDVVDTQSGDSDEDTSQPPNPCSVLSAAKTDPFANYAIPHYAHEAMDHALSFTWPQCLPTDLEKIVIPFRAAWMQLVMASPLVLHTFIFATTKQLLCLRGQKEDDMSQLAVRAPSIHQSEALNCARTEIEALNGPPSDGLILAVIILAVNGTRRPQIPPQPHPCSPLAKTQSLHLFSLLNVVEAHVRAVAHLVSLKGGLGAVDTYGVRDTLLLSDIYFSSILGTRPAQIWPAPVTSLVDAGLHVLDADAQRLLSQLGAGFDPFKLDKDLRNILQLMCDLVVALDHHVRRGDHPPQLSDIVLQRNAVQNKLLWLKPSPTDDRGGEDTLASMTRLAANIFSDMVLFPLSPATGIKPRLAGELRRCLRARPVLDIEEYGPPSGVFSWVLTLGGIAASFTRHRGWYIEKLAEHYGESLGDADAMLARMAPFLWWADVCDRPAKLLWAQSHEVYKEEQKFLAAA